MSKYKRNNNYIPISQLNFDNVDNQLLNDFKYPNFFKFYTKLGPKYNRIFNIYRSMLPSNDLKNILDIILRPCHHYDEKTFLQYLKEIGVLTLSYLTTYGINIDFRFFQELQNLSGYSTVLHKEYDIYNDTLPFTQHQPVNLHPILLKNVKKVINNLIIKKLSHTFSQYLPFRDNWNVDGVSTVGVPLSIMFSHSKKTRKFNTKWLTLLSFANKTLYKESLDNIDTYCYPFIKKDEASKARTVIGYCSWSYLRCSFLETFIDFSGINIWSTLGADPKKKKYTRDLINKAIVENKFLTCVDQSAFDQHQPKELIIFALKYLFNKILEKNPQTFSVIQTELQSLENVKLVLDKSSKIVRPWARGLLSGYKFTALLGSILNQAEFMTVCDLCKYKYSGGLFQGDDAIAWFDHPISKDKLVSVYSSLGFEVNSLKTWYSQKASEFLREVYYKDHVYGVPTRSALSIIFSKPKTYKPQPDQRFTKNLSNFMKAKRRGLCIDNLIISYLSKYLFSHYSFPISRNKFDQFLYNYLSTPAAFGGCPLFPFTPQTKLTSLVRTVSADKTKSQTFDIVSPIHYKPILNFKEVIYKRLKDRIQLADHKTSYTLVSLPKKQYFSKKHYLSYPIPTSINRPLPPTDWNYPANQESELYYANRLSLSINNNPLPSEYKKYGSLNYRKYMRFANYSFSFDDYITNQETHLQVMRHIRNKMDRSSLLLLRGFTTIPNILKKLYKYIYSYYLYLYNLNYYNNKKIMTFKNKLDSEKFFSSCVLCHT